MIFGSLFVNGTVAQRLLLMPRSKQEKPERIKFFLCKKRPRENKENCTPPIAAKKRPVTPRSRPRKKNVRVTRSKPARALSIRRRQPLGLMLRSSPTCGRSRVQIPPRSLELFARSQNSEVMGSIPRASQKKSTFSFLLMSMPGRRTRN